jgi:ATP-dependent Clp protease adaptor protein ClpS
VQDGTAGSPDCRWNNSSAEKITTAIVMTRQPVLPFISGNIGRYRLKYSTMTNQQRQDGGNGLLIEEATPKLKRPPLYKVVLLNDDYTPMEFVVEILEVFFDMTRAKATQIMLHVHTRGKGVCGVFTQQIAETKIAQVNAYSREHKHPLLCIMEEA